MCRAEVKQLKSMTSSPKEWPQTQCPSRHIGTRPRNVRDKAWWYAYKAPNDVGKVICVPCEKKKLEA